MKKFIFMHQCTNAPTTKPKLRRFFYFFAGLLLLVGSFSCQREEMIDKHEPMNVSSNFSIKNIDFKTLEYNQPANSLFQKIETHSRGIAKYARKGELNKLTVHTDEGVRVQKGDTHWLTFPIAQIPASKNIKNLILKWNKDLKTYKPYLVEYVLTPKQRCLFDAGKRTPNLFNNVNIVPLMKRKAKGRSASSGGHGGTCVETYTYTYSTPIYGSEGLIVGYSSKTRHLTVFCGGAGGTLNPGGVIIFNPPIEGGEGIPNNYPNTPNETPENQDTSNDTTGTVGDSNNNTGEGTSSGTGSGDSYTPPYSGGGGNGGSGSGVGNQSDSVVEIETVPLSPGGYSSFDQFLSHNTREEQAWLSKPEQQLFYAQLKFFLIKNNYSAESQYFGREAVDAKMNGGEVDFAYQLIVDPSVDECVNNIINDLKKDNSNYRMIPHITGNKTNLAPFILNTFNGLKNHNLIIKQANLPPNDDGLEVNAQTIPKPPVPGSGSRTFTYTVTLNNDYINNATDLAIARTIMHEALHAYISYMYQDQRFSDFAQAYQYHLAQFSGTTDPKNEAQHQYMLDFASALAESLGIWDNFSLGKQNPYYLYLSYSGAMTTTAFFEEELDTTFQQNCIDANISEGQASNPATSQALGTKSCK